jgi:hypothetical protein
LVVVATTTSHVVQQWMISRPTAVDVVRLPWFTQRDMAAASSSPVRSGWVDQAGRVGVGRFEAAMTSDTPVGLHIPI